MLSLLITSIIYFFFILSFCILLRLFLYQTSLIHVLIKWKHLVEDTIYVHQFFKVPQINNDNGQQNQFYKKVLTYLNSTSSLEDSDFTNLFAGKKSNDIVLSLDDNQTVHDVFLGARVSWKNEKRRTLVLRIKKKDKKRILRSYLQHIHTISDEIEQRKGELNLFINHSSRRDGDGDVRWSCVPFTHQSSFETMVMDSDVKARVKSDLESFLKSEDYYHRIGRVWKKNFLLYGPSGTGKSSFVAAMARFLSYDVYDLNLSQISDDSNLKMLLLQTTNKSLIVIEDLDHYLKSESTAVSLSGLLNFMDGIMNCDEKIMVFTMNSKEQIDPAILRPGRIDVQIYFPLCDFKSFKLFANSYLGVKEHKLFQQVEEVFHTANISPAEVSEIMIANRGSPSRAMKSVITALQTKKNTQAGTGAGDRRLDESVELLQSGVFGKDSLPVKELRKLYGLLKLKTLKKVGPVDYEPVLYEPAMIKR